MTDQNKEQVQKDEKDTTIRNVDMAEYAKKKKAEMAKAEPDNQENDDVELSTEDPKLKPFKSKFEPEAVLFKLPSEGVSIDKSKLEEDGQIYIRRTTTREEDMIYEYINRLTSIRSESEVTHFTYEMFVMIDRVIDSCIKTNIVASELFMCDREAMFNFIIALGYGSSQQIEYTCPKCGSKYTVKFDLIKDVKTTYMKDAGIKYPYTISLSSYKNIAIDIRFLKIGETQKIFNPNTSQSELFDTVTLRAYDINTGETIFGKDRLAIFENLNNADRLVIKKYLDSMADVGIKFAVNKKVCSKESCELYNKKVEVPYSLEFLLFDVVKVKNVLI